MGKVCCLLPTGSFLRSGSVARGKNKSHRLTAMALGLAKQAAHAAVQGLDGGIKDTPRRVEMARAQRVGIARKAGAGEGEGLGAQRPLESGGDVMRLHGLEPAIL